MSKVIKLKGKVDSYARHGRLWGVEA